MHSKTENNLKHKVMSAVAWRGMERFGTQAVGFMVSIFLARLLEPKDYGTIALLTVTVTLMGILVDSGFGDALVQRKEVTEKEWNSAFYLNLGTAFLLYIIVFLCAPLIASFYNEPILVPILRWMAVGLFFNAINSTQNAIIAREMKFRFSFYISLSQTVSYGVIGIAMACYGYGVWSLVFASLGSVFVCTCVRWSLIKWRPKLVFSWSSIKSLFQFSWKILFSSFIDTLFNNIYTLAIGKLFTPATLGYYNRGQNVPYMVIASVNSTVSGVMFPVLSRCQDNNTQARNVMRRMSATICFFIFPAMFGLAAIAKPLVLVLLTEKWLPSVPFLQIACISFAFWPLHVTNLQAIIAAGRSDIYLTLEIIKKSLMLLMIIATFKFGIITMALGQATLSPVCAAINAWPNRKLIQYSITEQVRDLFPTAGLSAVMGGIVFSLSLLPIRPFSLLLLQISVGVVFYASVALVLRLESAQYVWKTITPHFVSFFRKKMA